MKASCGSGGLDPFDFTPATLTIPPADNFTSGNTSDILFRNSSTGDTWYEAMNNGAPAGWNQIGGSSTSYGVIGTGDFFGTGTSDILYRNSSSGDTWFEAISNGVFVGWNQIRGSRQSAMVLSGGTRSAVPTPPTPCPSRWGHQTNNVRCWQIPAVGKTRVMSAAGES
jgi:hypothetical protein